MLALVSSERCERCSGVCSKNNNRFAGCLSEECYKLIFIVFSYDLSHIGGLGDINIHYKFSNYSAFNWWAHALICVEKLSALTRRGAPTLKKGTKSVRFFLKCVNVWHNKMCCDCCKLGHKRANFWAAVELLVPVFNFKHIHMRFILTEKFLQFSF